MLDPEALPDVVRRRDPPDLLVAAERPERVQDREHVDALLHDAPATGTSSPNAPRNIAPNASPIPATTLCSRDPPRAPRDRDRLGDPVQPVDDQHDVGGLRRGRRPARPHRDADVGRGERRARR